MSVQSHKVSFVMMHVAQTRKYELSVTIHVTGAYRSQESICYQGLTYDWSVDVNNQKLNNTVEKV